MYINIENSSKYFSHLVEHCTKKAFHRWPAQDQSCIEEFFSAPDDAVGWDWLDDSVINSRGFLDPNRFLTGGQGSASRSAVWHWHGYKANQIQCLFHAIKDGGWNVDNGPSFSIRRGGYFLCMQLYHEIVRYAQSFPSNARQLSTVDRTVFSHVS